MKKTIRHIVLSISLLALLSCSTTSTLITSTWKAPDYSGKIKKVLIIGVSDTQDRRIMYENYFAESLKKHGIETVQSYPLFSSLTGVPDKETIASAAKKSGADTVLLTQLVDSKIVETYASQEVYPAYDDLDEYYANSFDYFATPGYELTNREVVMQTNLYRAENQKLFYTVISDTTTTGTDFNVIKSFINAIVNRMQKEGFIK